MPGHARRGTTRGFTLIELLTVVAIISLLISILMPSLSRARDQAKSVHCLARLKDFGNAIATYENVHEDSLPPAMYDVEDPENPGEVLATYGWVELLWSFVYKEPVHEPENFPVMRNVNREKWADYFVCKASSHRGVNSGHYRVYLPSWAAGTYAIQEDGTFGEETQPDPWASVTRSNIRPKLPLLGDANEESARGDPCEDPTKMTSYIDAGEANEAGTTGRNGNRFSDRHYGGTNFLFQDFHPPWHRTPRAKLAVDGNLNGIDDIEIVP